MSGSGSMTLVNGADGWSWMTETSARSNHESGTDGEKEVMLLLSLADILRIGNYTRLILVVTTV